MGPALANLLSFTVYNAIRFGFLWKKFDLQPFSIKSLEVILIAVCCFGLVHVCFSEWHTFAGIVTRSMIFVGLYFLCIYHRNITPDLKPVLENVWKRFKKH